MLTTVVVDAEALARLDAITGPTGRLPRSSPVDRRHGRAWHAVEIDQGTLAVLCRLRRSSGEPFNDALRAALDLAPLEAIDTARPVRPAA